MDNDNTHHWDLMDVNNNLRVGVDKKINTIQQKECNTSNNVGVNDDSCHHPILSGEVGV